MYWAGPILGGIAAGLIYQLLLAVSDTISRPSNTGFGIWDLPQESSIKAKFGTLGLNWDFFGTIFIPFWDF